MNGKKSQLVGEISEIAILKEHLQLAKETLDTLGLEIGYKAEAVNALELKVRGTTLRQNAEKSRIRQELFGVKINDYESERRRKLNDELRALESEMLVKDKEFQ